jgi:hypothetical protein
LTAHAALPIVTLKISPYINVTLIFYFYFGLVHLVPGGYKYGHLALQVGGFSDETALYGYGS